MSSLQQNAKTEFIIIHVVRHQIACRLSYYASYMHGNGISRILITALGVYVTVNGNYLCWNFEAAIPTENGLQIVLYSIKLLVDCQISHSICTELAYMDY